mmetsp:Transcript_22464/g.66007  ORF Transcript_22464/g.66007 Transcript_22464/m.66007 type:complete len:396 (+) Transcript_22464:830-2017(+)
MRHALVDHLDREGGPHPRLQVAAVRLAVRRGARSGGLGAAGSGALWPAAGEGGGCLGGDDLGGVEHARPHVDARARPAAAAAVRVRDQVAEDPVQPQAVREDLGLQEGLVDLDAEGGGEVDGGDVRERLQAELLGGVNHEAKVGPLERRRGHAARRRREGLREQVGQLLGGGGAGEARPPRGLDVEQVQHDRDAVLHQDALVDQRRRSEGRERGGGGRLLHGGCGGGGGTLRRSAASASATAASASAASAAAPRLLLALEGGGGGDEVGEHVQPVAHLVAQHADELLALGVDALGDAALGAAADDQAEVVVRLEHAGREDEHAERGGSQPQLWHRAKAEDSRQSPQLQRHVRAHPWDRHQVPERQDQHRRPEEGLVAAAALPREEDEGEAVDEVD